MKKKLVSIHKFNKCKKGRKTSEKVVLYTLKGGEIMEETFKFIATAMIVPILIGILTSYISFKMSKPKEYFIRESFDLEKLDITSYFPLHVGNYWTYSRDMSIDAMNGNREIKDEVTVDVIKHYKNGEMDLFVMKGDPLLQEDVEKANDIIYGYIIISNKVIKVGNDKIDLFVEKFKAKQSIYANDTDGLYIEYEFPLYSGQRYGEFSQLFRHDAKNISYVTKLLPYRKKVGENIMDIGIYQIDNLYNSGDEQKTFTPYLGVTEFTYEHRGTVYKYLISLKEYKIKED